MKRNLKIIIIISLFISRTVFAGDISISRILPATADIKVGDEVLVGIELKSDGTEYNAIDGILEIPSIFEIEKVVTGNSFVSIWVKNPANFEGNKIEFSGIAPAGYNQEVGAVFSVVLKAISPGSGNISINKSSIFRNDGVGTEDKISGKSLVLNTREIKSGEVPYSVSVKDVTPPEEFTATLVKDPKLYGGKYALIWSASDKGSGISSYDVITGRKVFKHVASPYVFPNQLLNGKIRVVAYDTEGNIRTSEVPIPGKVCLGVSCFGVSDAVFLFGVVVAIIYIIWRKRKNK